jgi:alkylation response protein AidB-like acyl-CoA dehydrogenase
MDFSLTDRQKALRERLESFCSEHCTEKEAARLDREPAFPAELYRALVDSGLLGYCLPERYGGEGGGALDADYILTAVRSDPEARPSRGISLFLVPRETPGLHIAPMEKIAGNAIASCRVTYDGVQVTKDALLGAENGAWPMLMLGGGFERVVVAASAVGAAAAALDEMLHFAREREQFGQPIGGFQAPAGIPRRLADRRWATAGQGSQHGQAVRERAADGNSDARHAATGRPRLFGGNAHAPAAARGHARPLRRRHRGNPAQPDRTPTGSRYAARKLMPVRDRAESQCQGEQADDDA